MPPAFRNHRAPTARGTPAEAEASSLDNPAAIEAQNCRRSSRPATGGRPGGEPARDRGTGRLPVHGRSAPPFTCASPTRPRDHRGTHRRSGSWLPSAVELRLSKIGARFAQNLVGLAQLAVLSLKRFDALALVGPARRPSSRSAWRTQFYRVWAVQPILAAIEAIVAHCEVCSPRCSSTIRTARSRTSGENL